MSDKEKDNLQEVSEVFKELGSAIGIVNKELGKTFESFSKVCEMVSNIEDTSVFKGAVNRTTEVLNISKYTKEAVQGVFEKIEKTFKKLKSIESKEIFDKICGYLKDFSKTLKFAFSDAKDKVKGVGNDLKEVFVSIKNNPFDALSESISTYVAAITSVFTVGIAGGIALAATAIAGFAAYFKHLMDTNEEFNDKVTELWSNVTEAFQPAIDAFGELFACLVTGRETVDTEGNAIVESFLTVTTVITEALAVVVGSIAEVISGVAQFIKDIVFTTAGETEGKTVTTWQVITDAIGNAWELLKEIFGAGAEVISAIWNAVGDEIVVVFAAVWETVADLLDGAVDLINGVMDIVVGIFTRDGDKIKEGFDGVVEGIKDAVSGIVGFFGDIWNVIKGQFTSIAVTIADGVSGAFKSVVNKILNYAGGVINGFVRAINGDAYHKQVLKRVQVIMGE